MSSISASALFAGCALKVCPTETLQYSREYELVGETQADCVIDLMARLKKQVEEEEKNKAGYCGLIICGKHF